MFSLAKTMTKGGRRCLPAKCERGVNTLGGWELFSLVQRGAIRLNKGNNLCDWVEGKKNSKLEPSSHVE